MDRWSGRVALVTGASVGIGAACVRNLVRHGIKVVACARNLEQLEALKTELASQPGSVYPVKCDVTKEEEILSMFADIKKNPELGGVDICINNAGCGHNAPLLDGETKLWRNMLEVNVLGAAICTREAVKSMRERMVDDGQIIYISSMSGHRVYSAAVTHFYSATKHAVKAMLEGVRNELRDMKSHIRVAAISPGYVETEFSIRLHEGNQEPVDKIFKNMQAIQAEDIADNVEFILKAPPHVQNRSREVSDYVKFILEGEGQPKSHERSLAFMDARVCSY